MKSSRKAPAILSLMTGCILALPLSSGIAQGTDPATENPRFSLLIGVGNYPGLGPGEQLDGSANDVAAMRNLLIERFGFSEQRVATLVDEQATGDGIRKAMDSLIETIAKLPAGTPPAQVVVHFSGHGSQIPDQVSGPDHDEDDGLDETWVPYDATKQGGGEDIRDDEINKLVHGICGDGKARLLIVFDCCHSGTGARGATKVRQLHRDVTPTKVSPDTPITRKRLPDGAVFLSACRAREVEPEFQEDDKTYGLLTRFLVQTLSEERVVSELSYDLLQKAIVAGYQRDRRVMQAPAPQLEGDPASLQKTILGFGPDVNRPPYYSVGRTSSSDRVLLRAGKFHNVTVGSLFELFERPQQITSSAGAAKSSLAWLRISKVGGTTSEAQVIRWEDDERIRSVGHTLPKTFKKGFAILRNREPDDAGLRLKVVRVTGVDRDSAPLGPSDPKLPKVIADMLNVAKQQGETQWLNWVTEQDQACDLVLRMDGHYASLFPATGMAEVAEPATKTRGDVPRSLRGGWGPIDLRTGKDNSDPPQTLNHYLRQITRARNLISLAQSGAALGASDYNVKMELMDVMINEEEQIISQEPWKPDKEVDGVLENVLSVPEDAVYALRVTNQGGTPVYVTVLEISPSMGIQVVMPFEEPPIKLEPGENRIGAPFRCTPPHGTNQALLLVTREPADFSFVAQADLPKTRGAPLVGGAGSLTYLLAEVAFFQPPQTRGGSRVRRKKSDTTWHAETLTWRSTR